MNEHTAQEPCPRASASRQVGIFYIIDGALYLECTPVLEAEDYGDFKSHPNGHVEFWPRLVKRLNILRPLSYDYYPRGRVNYAKPEGRYRLYLDSCLLKERHLVQSIIQHMHLADQEVAIATDEHYQCAVCNRNYVPDVI
jgi:hypothetical protein